MDSLVEILPKEIARLEALHGSDSKFVQHLKRQLAAIQDNQGKTGEEVYNLQSVKFPVKETEKPQASSSNPELDELNQQIEDWATKGIYEAAAHQMSTDFPSEKTDESPSSTSANEKD